MLHVFAQYHDPRVLTVLVDGEFWGREGGVRNAPTGTATTPGQPSMMYAIVEPQSGQNWYVAL